MPRIPETVADAFETFGQPGHGQLFLTCEHASNRVPAPLRTTVSDRAWLATHWGYDIGARNFTRELVRLTDSYAVMARFSRLVCDANRSPDHGELIRRDVVGTVMNFNRDVSPEERARRLDTLHSQYHGAIHDGLTARRAQTDAEVVLLSVHSFTPVWNNRVRPMDIGVLFEPFEAVAKRLAGELEREGYETALNKPYAAREGLIYAADRHGRNHGVVYLELELNQALVCTPARARRTAKRVANALSRFRVRKMKRD